MDIAKIDRRVQVEGKDGPETRRVSELRSEPFVVLLGEPGIGKSAVLQLEAEYDGVDVLTCRAVTSGLAAIPHGSPVYLDGLDEYRSSGDGKQKIVDLAKAIIASGSRRWRLTCRAEDWREAADLSVMRAAARGGKVAVAYIQPLSTPEAEDLLVALGEASPSQFLNRAFHNGADGLLQNPLSLRLLWSTVRDDAWPSTRFELFEKATKQLAHEHDADRSHDADRPSAEELREASALICFYLLATGANALWRSNAPAPERSGSLAVADLPVTRHVADWSLDTALFRGGGDVFQPMHRSVGEFLAGWWLARLVTGKAGASFPFLRALAFIVGRDEKAPSDLRGLYAWFAAHLAAFGDEFAANSMVTTDAATCLAYGDAAVFETPQRRLILQNLDRDDPFFRSSQSGDSTVVGGLAGEDLAEDFRMILNGDPSYSQTLLTVFVALAEGAPVPSLRDLLHSIALDETRPMWHRARAGEAWIRGSADAHQARLGLLEEVAAQTISAPQITLRSGWAAPLKAALPTPVLRQLLVDFASFVPPAATRLQPGDILDEDDDLDEQSRGSISGLSYALRDDVRPELFDEPLGELMSSEGEDGSARFEIEHLMETVLAATIRANANVLGATRLGKWLAHVRLEPWDPLASEVTRAISEWLAMDKHRRGLEFLMLLADGSGSNVGGWAAVNDFIQTTGSEPAPEVFGDVLDRAIGEQDAVRRRRLFELAERLAHLRSAPAASHWRLVEALTTEPTLTDLLSSAIQSQLSWRLDQLNRNLDQAKKEEATRTSNLAILAPLITQLDAGDAGVFGHLVWSARLYRGEAIRQGENPLARIIKFSNDDVAHACANGWQRFAARGEFTSIDIAALAGLVPSNKSFTLEEVVVAGVHRALSTGREPDLDVAPPITAIMGLRQLWSSNPDNDLVADWAFRRLSKDIAVGADALVEYWLTCFDKGAEELEFAYRIFERLDSVGDLAAAACMQLLKARPAMPAKALEWVVRILAKTAPGSLGDLAEDHLKSSSAPPQDRDIWVLVNILLQPAGARSRHPYDAIERAAYRANSELGNSIRQLGGDPVEIDSLIVSVIGAVHPPDPNDWKRGHSPSGSVRGALQRLHAVPTRAAMETLHGLLTDGRLKEWSSQLRHAAAEQSRLLRDEEFVHPTPEALSAALDGGAPVNALDLRAIAVDELSRFRATLRTDQTTPWKGFWNTGSTGDAINPKIENECRDGLLNLLQYSLRPYRITAALKEVARGENTRVDILLMSQTGMNLPIEVKRHYNGELWTAASTQLLGYAADPGASGYGVYLVFWFGIDVQATPARPDGGDRPGTAESLEKMLTDDLPSNLKSTTKVFVLDVSRPPEMIARVEAANSRKCVKKRRPDLPSDPA